MKRDIIMPIAWVAIYTLAVALKVPEWFIWSVIVAVFLIGVLDYYWLGGKLSGRSYEYGEK